MVPKKTQEITILGEVQSPTSHVYEPGLTRGDYIAKSGGTTQKADKKRIYVVRANGDVVTGGRTGWFRRTPIVRDATGRYDRRAARHRAGRALAALAGGYDDHVQLGHCDIGYSYPLMIAQENPSVGGLIKTTMSVRNRANCSPAVELTDA